MRLRNTLFLALAFAALAAYVYLVELQRAPKEENEAALSFEPSAITRIELEHPGRLVVLQREDGKWRMSEPVAVSADERNVENLLEAIHESKVVRTFEDVDNLATYGLDVPSASVRLHTGADGVVELKLGKKAPVGNSVYIQRGGDSAVHLTDASLMTRIDLEATALRDKTVLAFEAEAVKWFRLRGSREVTLREEDGGWKITTPAEYEADGTVIGSFLSTLRSLRAMEFVDDGSDRLARYGLDEPRQTLTLGMTDGGEVEMRVGTERDGKLYVQTNRESTVYAVAAWVRESLDRDANHFRDKTISRFVADEAATIEIDSTAEGSFELLRSNDGWTLAGQPAVESTVDEIIGTLSNLSGFEIAADAPEDLSAFGLAPPHSSLRVRDRNGAKLASVRIGSYPADGARTEYTAAHDGSPTVFHLRQFDFERLATGQTDLVGRKPGSEGSSPPIPDGESGDGVDEDSLDDAAAAGEER